MKKMMILVTVMIGTISSVSVLLAMDNKGALQNDVRVERDQQKHVVSPLDLQRDPVATTQEASRRHTESQRIEGHVIDLRGNPARGVEVIGMKSERGALLRSKTDENGHFSFEGISVGTYEVFVKDKDGPICPSCLFYSGGILQPQVNVHVLERQVTSGIVVQMTPKWAKFKGRILDAKTNEPIVASTITLRRAENPDYSLITGPDEKGNFTIPVPSVPITVEVSAAGYETWRYQNGHGKRLDLLKVNSGETKSLTVWLRH